CYTRVPSPLGPLLLVVTADALTSLWLPSGRDRQDPEPDWVESARPFKRVVRQLDAYFAGRLRQFDLPLAPVGTAFQQRVWRALCGISPRENPAVGALARRGPRPGPAPARRAAARAQTPPRPVPPHPGPCSAPPAPRS